ncbi:hypothetical protein F4Z99_11215 [Candidatus Poribacteria bacterium]|nr:hypothetical protein [Candidatus Poribacteria bacterium]MYB02508.1 hypothetical protein [Candidatus Poribacteria bacterium]
MKNNEKKLAHQLHGVDIYREEKTNFYYIKKDGQFFRLSIPPGRLEPPNPNRPRIIALYKDEREDQYFDATPWSVFATFKLQGHKVRGYMKDDGHFYILTIKIDGKRKKPYKISASKILQCTEGSWVYEDGKFYILLETIQTFVHQFTERFAVEYLNLPYQMMLPIYQQTKSPTLSHNTLEIL